MPDLTGGPVDDTDETEIDPSEADQEREQEEPLPPLPGTLVGSPLKLRVPADVAERWDLYLQALRVPNVSYLRVYGAALGLCWPHLRRVLAKSNIVHTGDTLRFGGTVQHLLFTGSGPIAEPVDVNAFRVAGAHAVRLINASIVGGEAVKARRDFTSAPDEGR
jgi:hypothetical protein